MLALKNPTGCCGKALHGCTAGGLGPVLTVWLFNMNWTALSFTSFLTLLYVSGAELRGKHRRYPTLWHRGNSR